MNDLFIGRQPILDTSGKVCFYELLYRQGSANRAPSEDTKATASVLNLIINYLGIRHLLHTNSFVINITPEVLRNNALLSLIPKEQFILELKATTPLDDALLASVTKAREQGYRLSLDHYSLSREEMERLTPLFPLLHFLKVDLRQAKWESIATLLPTHRTYPMALIADKVETQEQAQMALRAGFSYLQGYFYQQPKIDHIARITPTARATLLLIGKIEAGAETEVIAEELRRQPTIAINLLQYINSASFSLSTQISSIEQTIATIGRENLRQWLSLFLFLDAPSNPHAYPLMESALVRAKLMQRLALHLEPTQKNRAYLVGLLSVLEALFGMSMEKLLEDTRFDAEILQALIGYEGVLGKLLRVTIDAENENFGAIHALLPMLKLTADEFVQMLTDSYQFADAQMMRLRKSGAQ